MSSVASSLASVPLTPVLIVIVSVSRVCTYTNTKTVPWDGSVDTLSTVYAWHVPDVMLGV